MSFIKATDAAQQLGMKVPEVKVLAERKGIKRWTQADVDAVKAEMERLDIKPNPDTLQLEESEPQTQEEIPENLHEVSDECGLTTTEATDLERQQQLREEVADEVTINQQAIIEEVAQDAIAIGQKLGLSRYALTRHAENLTYAKLLELDSQQRQQETQTNLANIGKAFDLTLLGNGTQERLGKSQLGSHRHRTKTTENLEAYRQAMGL